MGGEHFCLACGKLTHASYGAPGAEVCECTPSYPPGGTNDPNVARIAALEAEVERLRENWGDHEPMNVLALLDLYREREDALRAQIDEAVGMLKRNVTLAPEQCRMLPTHHYASEEEIHEFIGRVRRGAKEE